MGPLVLAVFKSSFSRDQRSVAAERLHAQVDTYLGELRSVGENVPHLAGRALCVQWMNDQWLFRTIGASGQEEYSLTSHALEALDLVQTLSRERALISESRINTILDAVRRWATEANPDREARIGRLDVQIQHLTSERDRLLTGGDVAAASDDRMLDGYANLIDLIGQLPSDFKRVEESVLGMHRQIISDFRNEDCPIGEVLDEYLRKTDELTTLTAEGRAFEGAFTLLRDAALLLELKSDLQTILEHPFAAALTAAEQRDFRGAVTIIRRGIDDVLAQRSRLTTTLRDQGLPGYRGAAAAPGGAAGLASRRERRTRPRSLRRRSRGDRHQCRRPQRGWRPPPRCADPRMSQSALLYLPGATEGTTQWKAETLQMVNWGGFQGHAHTPIAPTATLLSGASGTGKSTLLDAYLALMMPSDTPFNGASNDATTGRARGVDQRNLLTYLRGKLDTGREAGTGELTDQVLRGSDGATWGGVAMTFVDDNGRRLTVLRAYFVPRGATKSADITMKMATIDGRLDLRDLEPLAASRFDKRTLTARWPDMAVHHTYTDFSQTLFTRLGIGASGDGSKALWLLARIQGGQQVRTVDGLYKSLVLEEPTTYAAADKAISHFIDLDASYQAMLTESEKARLLDTAAAANREQRRTAAERFKTARDLELSLQYRIEDVVSQQKANGGDALEQLKRELEGLEARRDDTANRRAVFDNHISCLGIAPATIEDFTQARVDADSFLAGFESRYDEISREQRKVSEAGYPLTVRREELQAEHDSLKGRTGLVPRRLHEARLIIAAATGIDHAELPFVAELIDLAPGEQDWRKAAEVTLFSVARVMLIDERRLEHLSAVIDPIRLPFRIQFEGVALSPHRTRSRDPLHISGKLLYKDSPFSGWVQERVRRRGTDALCVNSPADLRGDGARVTRSGQTRHGSRGAHGELSDVPIIGFSNADRLAQIAADVAALTAQVGELARIEKALDGQLREIWQRKQAHQHVADCTWDSIDVSVVDEQIRDREDQRERILAANDVLQTLQHEEKRLRGDLEDASREKFGAEHDRKTLDEEHRTLVHRQDRVSVELSGRLRKSVGG